MYSIRHDNKAPNVKWSVNGQPSNRPWNTIWSLTSLQCAWHSIVSYAVTKLTEKYKSWKRDTILLSKRSVILTCTHYKTVMEELKVEPGDKEARRYKWNWPRHVTRMNSSRMAEIMMNCRPNGQRRLGRPLKRLVDKTATGLSRCNWWRMMMMMMMMILDNGKNLPPPPPNNGFVWAVGFSWFYTWSLHFNSGCFRNYGTHIYPITWRHILEHHVPPVKCSSSPNPKKHSLAAVNYHDVHVCITWIDFKGFCRPRCNRTTLNNTCALVSWYIKCLI